MGAPSQKQKYLQLTDWLSTFKKKSDTKRIDKRDSRIDYLKEKGHGREIS